MKSRTHTRCPRLSRALSRQHSRGTEVQHTIDFLLLVLLVLDRGDVHRRMIREDEPSRLEVAVTGFEHGIQHRLVKEEVAHPFGNNDIKLLDWKLCILEFSFYEGDS
jgi:hypothetical protein